MVGPINNVNNAIAAYNRALKGGDGTDRPADSGFAGLVKDAVREAVKIGNSDERLSVKAVQNTADLNEVVTAVAEADLALQTVVAVRDRVIEAYKDIMRMPI